MDKISEFLRDEKKITDVALGEFLEAQEKSFGGLDPDYKELLKQIRVLVLRGGKRARSTLVRLGYQLASGKKLEKSVVKASLFVELVHLNLLIHDDIADNDLRRYGGPTLEVVFRKQFKDRYDIQNKHFGRTLAMISGDYLLNLAHQALHESGVADKRKVESELIMAKVLSETFAGWQAQYWLNYEKISETSEKRFLKGMELVSVKYSFEAPLLVGLALAGETKKHGERLREYAYHVGMAFQIQDDILGVFGESGDTGKPSGNDVREGKKTLLVLRAYKNGGKNVKDFLEQMVGYNVSKSELERVRKIIVDTGSLEYSEKLALAHVRKAKKALKNVESKNKEVVEILGGLAEFVVERKH